MSGSAPESIKTTIADPRLQLAIYTATGRLMQHRATSIAGDRLPQYQDLRTQANAVKRHTIENSCWA